MKTSQFKPQYFNTFSGNRMADQKVDFVETLNEF